METEIITWIKVHNSSVPSIWKHRPHITIISDLIQPFTNDFIERPKVKNEVIFS